MDDLLDRLRTSIGADHVLTEDADVAAYVVDWTGTHAGRALAVVRPGSTEEVAAVVAACAGAGAAVVPQGGNTGLVGGGVPDASGSQVVLSLGRMRRVREVDPVAVRAMAQQPGGDLVLGGPDLAATFVRHGLLDEVRLYVHPVVIGQGRRVFADDARLDLTLLESRTFGCGVVLLRYACS